MRSAQIAEWILALFLESDRAAAYAGDLMEEAAGHGPLWFWSSVARLIIMRFWYDVVESPFYLASVLLRASILYFVIAAALVFGFSILDFFTVLFAALLHTRLDPEQGRWVGAITGDVIIALGPFYTGRWIARRMPGREIVACLAMCAAQPLFYSLIGFAVMQFWGTQVEHYILTHANNVDQTAYPSLPDRLISLTIYAGFLLAGGLRTRLRKAAQ